MPYTKRENIVKLAILEGKQKFYCHLYEMSISGEKY